MGRAVFKLKPHRLGRVMEQQGRLYRQIGAAISVHGGKYVSVNVKAVVDVMLFKIKAGSKLRQSLGNYLAKAREGRADVSALQSL